MSSFKNFIILLEELEQYVCNPCNNISDRLVNELLNDVKEKINILYLDMNDDERKKISYIYSLLQSDNNILIKWINNKIIKFKNYENPFTTTCQGCIEEQPNQLAHMEFGGCLYN
jgi:hypothetical protein